MVSTSAPMSPTETPVSLPDTAVSLPEPTTLPEPRSLATSLPEATGEIGLEESDRMPPSEWWQHPRSPVFSREDRETWELAECRTPEESALREASRAAGGLLKCNLLGNGRDALAG